MQLQSVLLILLPVLTPMIGSSLAAILAQDKWPTWLNDGIAWLCLCLIAGMDMWANNQFSSGWVMAVADAVQLITFLASGWLVKLAPWLAWLAWLQANLFNLVPLFEDLNKPAPVNANPVRVPVAITLPSDATPVPPRASAPPTPPGA